MELTATQVGEIRTQKKELEFMPITNSSPKKNTQKVYHKKLKMCKIIANIKNIVITVFILWLMWKNQLIIKDTVFTDCVSSGTFACISYYTLSSVDRWISYLKEGGAYGR